MPGDRTEQGTPHRREKARDDGDLLRSRELSSAAGTLAGVLCLGIVWPRMIKSFRSEFGGALNLGSPELWQIDRLQRTLLDVRRLGAMALIPVGLFVVAIAGTAALSGILQTGGLHFTASSVSLKLNRVSPASNLKNLFSLRTVSLLAKSLIPASILGVFGARRIAREFAIPAFSVQRMEALGSDVYGLLATTAWLMLAWALIDYLVEWRSRESRLMMSREEMKQEFKETEGNPQLRSRIRGLQRQMRRHKVKVDVAKAAVVLTNPTHYAVALGFDLASMDAPRILAKGRNLRAEEIKVEARWAGVPIVENPPLARSLYRSVEVGHAIPTDLYAAVAAILAYLYRQRVQEEIRDERVRQSAGSTSAASAGVPSGNPHGASTHSMKMASAVSTSEGAGQ